MRKISEEQKLRILDSLAKHSGSYEAVSKELSVSMRVIQVVDVIENKKFNYTPEGKGRPELQQYIIGTRDLSEHSGWDNDDPVIKKAREDYDAGLVDMATARDGMISILYAFPLKKVVNRKPWFKSNVVELELKNVQTRHN